MPTRLAAPRRRRLVLKDAVSTPPHPLMIAPADKMLLRLATGFY